MTETKNVLLLSGPMGSGHIRAAEAIREKFASSAQNCRVVYIDTTVWLNWILNFIFLKLYPFLLRHAPGVWRFIHRSNNRKNRGFFKVFFDLTASAAEKKLLAAIEKNKIDFVLSVHFYPAYIVARLKRQGRLTLPSAVVITDHTAHRIYAEKEHDMIFVPNQLGFNRLIEWGVPAEKLCISGCPVCDIFCRDFPQETVKDWYRQLQISPEYPWLMLTMGGWGTGHMVRIIVDLLRVHRDFGIFALTGHNSASFRQLSNMAKRYPSRLRVVSFTTEIHKYMAVSRFVITKPGGITTSECIAMRKPMLLVDPIAGHEEKNQQYLIERGVAVAATRDDLAESVTRMRTEMPRLQKNMEQLALQIKKATQTIVDRSLDLAYAYSPEKPQIKTVSESLLRRFLRLSLYFCFGAVLAGCAPVLTEELDHHIITADGNGAPVFYDIYEPNTGITLPGEGIKLEDHLRHMREEMEKSGRKKVMIYCFGGMNSANETVEISAENIPVIMRDSDVYPIFVNWESELFDCYFNHLFAIRNGLENFWTGPVLVPFYFTADMLGALIQLPPNLYYQSVAMVEHYDEEHYNEMAGNIVRRDGEIQFYLGRDFADHRLLPLIRLGYFVGFPFRILTTSLIDGFAPRAWDEMRRRARVSFVRDTLWNGEADISDPSLMNAPPDGVFSHFAEMLIQYTKDHPDTEITLIGHSMGSFLITEVLARYPELPVKNIVFMAAASSVQETVYAVKPYLLRHRDAHFYNLSLHPFVEYYDMMDYCVLPCGSILTWVNQHLAPPVSKEDYTVGIWDASVALLPRMMRGVENQVTVKGFGLYDPVTNTNDVSIPSQHTDFSSLESRFWRPEFWNIPKK